MTTLADIMVPMRRVTGAQRERQRAIDPLRRPLIDDESHHVVRIGRNTGVVCHACYMGRPAWWSLWHSTHCDMPNLTDGAA